MNQPKQLTFVRRIISILFFAAAATSALGQGILVNSSTRNGSFENGVYAPWQGFGVLSQNSAFASHGEWFVVLSTSAPDDQVRVNCGQFLLATPGNGLSFIAAFEARNGVTGFNSISASLLARNADGTFVNALATPLVSPPLTSFGWGSYQIQFELPETWDGSGDIRIIFEFENSSAVPGTIYSGYLDNVTLQQIPEPSTSALFGTAALIMTTRFWIRQRM